MRGPRKHGAMVDGRLALGLVLMLTLAGCTTPAGPAATTTTEPTSAARDATDAPTPPAEPPSTIPGPQWKPGYTWSFKSTGGRGGFSYTSWDTQAVVATGIAHGGATYGLIARASGEDKAPPAPGPANATDWGAFAAGSPGIHGFDPGDYACTGPRFCFDDPEFLALLSEPTGDPPFPLVTGATWNETTTVSGLDLRSNGTVLGLRDVTVPAGTFQAVHLRMTHTLSSGPLTMRMEFEADYAEATQSWIRRAAFEPGDDQPQFQEELAAFSLVEAPGTDLATLAVVVKPLALSITPPGPYNAADATVLRLHASGGSGLRTIEVLSDDWDTDAQVEDADLLWTANRTGRWMAAVFDDGYDYEFQDIDVTFDATADVACTLPAPLGAGGCATFPVPIGPGSNVLRAWANATVAPLGGKLELVRPDGIVEASVETATGTATLSGDVSERSGTWTVRWTPAAPVPDTVALHVTVDLRQQYSFEI